MESLAYATGPTLYTVIRCEAHNPYSAGYHKDASQKGIITTPAAARSSRTVRGPVLLGSVPILWGASALACARYPAVIR